MSVSEKRRATRLRAVREEITVIHDQQLNIPGLLSDLSTRGALIRFFNVPGWDLPQDYQPRNNVFVSLQAEKLPFAVKSRVIRQGPQFLAVEFVDGRSDVTAKIATRIRELE